MKQMKPGQSTTSHVNGKLENRFKTMVTIETTKNLNHAEVIHLNFWLTKCTAFPLGDLKTNLKHSL